MTLNLNSYAVLGLIAMGNRSGYEVQRAADRSMRWFWILSPPQVYDGLTRLEREGLLVGTASPRGGRERRLYDLTAAGERALAEWLREDGILPLQYRDPMLLKVFLAQSTQPAALSRHLAALQRRAGEALERVDELIAGAALPDQEGAHERVLTTRFARGLQRWIHEWVSGVATEAVAQDEPRAPRFTLTRVPDDAAELEPSSPGERRS